MPGSGEGGGPGPGKGPRKYAWPLPSEHVIAIRAPLLNMSAQVEPGCLLPRGAGLLGERQTHGARPVTGVITCPFSQLGPHS